MSYDPHTYAQIYLAWWSGDFMGMGVAGVIFAMIYRADKRGWIQALVWLVVCGTFAYLIPRFPLVAS